MAFFYLQNFIEKSIFNFSQIFQAFSSDAIRAMK